ncbi:MAG: hypothetical protein HFJ36_04275, partial [Clostridia bacterium]|nr:hypothetical protein [Clostridia bacterium]
MNKKRTNRLVAISNIIAVASIYILAFSTKYLLSSIMTGNNEGKSIFNSFIIDTLLNNIQIIMTLVYCGMGILNIICAIQNKENKKIFFWQLVFGICILWNGSNIILDLQENEFIELIIFGIVPIILAIINLILIRKNKPKVIQVISYIGVIILSILNIIGIIGSYWNIICIVMQLIY